MRLRHDGRRMGRGRMRWWLRRGGRGGRASYLAKRINEGEMRMIGHDLYLQRSKSSFEILTVPG